MLALVLPAGAGHRKKLEEAARLWARGAFKDQEQHEQQDADANDALDEQFAALGIVPDGPVHVSDPLLPFYLFPENVSAWALFMGVQTQWRGGMAREGLDYPGVQVVIGERREWRRHRRQRFAEVQLMERAALDEWGQQRLEQQQAVR